MKMVRNRLWLKEIREIKEKTQEKLAQETGVTRQHIGLIENGVTNPSPELAKKIAEVLDFDWTRFYEHEVETKK